MNERATVDMYVNDIATGRAGRELITPTVEAGTAVLAAALDVCVNG